MQRSRSSVAIAAAVALLAGCSDGLAPTAADPAAGETRLQEVCEIHDDAENRVRTVTAACRNTDISVPTGWTVRVTGTPPPAGPADAAVVTPTGAAVTAFENPDSAYLAQTRLIDISGVPDLTLTGVVSDGTQTVRFAMEMLKLSVPSTWATWSCPPFSESCDPHVLYSNNQVAISMTLDEPADIVGFELSPNVMDPHTIRANFYSEGTLVGSVSRVVSGDAGARLFAARAEDVPFDQVVVTGQRSFAIAQLRYGLDVPPPPVEVAVESVYSGDPASDPGILRLEDEYLYLEILDVDRYLGRSASAGDVRIGATFATATPAESFRILDIDRDGTRDVRVRWSMQRLVQDGRLNPSTRTLTVWGKDPATGETFRATTEVDVETGAVVLHDNGGFVTHPGAGAGGADVHMAATWDWAVNAQRLEGGPHYRVADRFTVDAGGWEVSRFVTRAVQALVPAASWDHFHARVWDGRPGDAGSSVVATTSSASTAWSGAYAVGNDAPLHGTELPVFEIHWNTAGLFLPEGEYWIDWQLDGGDAWAIYVTHPNPANPNNPILGQGWARLLSPDGWGDVRVAGVVRPATPFQVVGNAVAAGTAAGSPGTP